MSSDIKIEFDDETCKELIKKETTQKPLKRERPPQPCPFCGEYRTTLSRHVKLCKKKDQDNESPDDLSDEESVAFGEIRHIRKGGHRILRAFVDYLTAAGKSEGTIRVYRNKLNEIIKWRENKRRKFRADGLLRPLETGARVDFLKSYLTTLQSDNAKHTVCNTVCAFLDFLVSNVENIYTDDATVSKEQLEIETYGYIKLRCDISAIGSKVNRSLYHDAPMRKDERRLSPTDFSFHPSKILDISEDLLSCQKFQEATTKFMSIKENLPMDPMLALEMRNYITARLLMTDRLARPISMINLRIDQFREAVKSDDGKWTVDVVDKDKKKKVTKIRIESDEFRKIIRLYIKYARPVCKNSEETDFVFLTRTGQKLSSLKYAVRWMKDLLVDHCGYYEEDLEKLTASSFAISV